MPEKDDFFKTVEELCQEDPRYKPDAYEFLMQALYFTQKKINRQGHLSGRELLDGIRGLAIEKYGPMAKTVLNHWGITQTGDFGNIVFNLIGKQVLSKSEADQLNDFNAVYDFEAAFGNVLRDSVIKQDE